MAVPQPFIISKLRLASVSQRLPVALSLSVTSDLR